MSEEYISKSQRKRDMHALQAIGEQLVALNKHQLAEMTLSDTLRSAIAEYKRITTHEAKRRQMQYIGRLMPNEEVESIKDALHRLESSGVEAAKQLHDLENWRARLLDDPKKELTEWVNQYPQTDVQHFRHLVTNAQKEKETGKPAGAGRALFRYLRQISSDSSRA